MKCYSRRSCGGALLCLGVLLLGLVLLPASCIPFIIGLVLVLKGWSMLKRSGCC